MSKENLQYLLSTTSLFSVLALVSVAHAAPLGGSNAPTAKSSRVTLLNDCPTTVTTIVPARTVAQFINNKYHEWEEYDLTTTPDGTRYCIRQIKPLRKNLSVNEAKQLLENSSQWKTGLAPLPQATTRSINTGIKTRDKLVDPKQKNTFDFNSQSESEEDLPAKPIYPSRSSNDRIRTIDDFSSVMMPAPQDAVGSDNRVKIADTTVYPFNTICYMEMEFEDGTYRGSGWLVGPNSVLTCGHNIFDIDTRVPVLSMTATPGQRVVGGSIEEPYGSRDISRMMCSDSYRKVKPTITQFDYDYAVVNFNTPFAGNGTYMPIEFGITPKKNSYLTVTGFPAKVRNAIVYDMFTDTDTVNNTYPRRIEFAVDTSGGNSGGPVYQTLDDTSLLGISVLTYGYTDGSANGATRLTTENKPAITEWMQYDPAAFSSIDLAASGLVSKYNGKKGILSAKFNLTNNSDKEVTTKYKIYLSNDPILDGGDFLGFERAINLPSSTMKNGKALKKPKPTKINLSLTADGDFSGKYLIVAVDGTGDPDLTNNATTSKKFK